MNVKDNKLWKKTENKLNNKGYKYKKERKLKDKMSSTKTCIEQAPTI